MVHYNQDYPAGELQARMKNDMAINMATFFAQGILSGGRVSWATTNPRTRDLPFGELQLEAFFFYCFPVLVQILD